MILILKRVISACAKGVQWRQALCLLAVMQETDLVPNVITYSAAIGAVKRVLNGGRSQRTVRSMPLAFWR